MSIQSTGQELLAIEVATCTACTWFAPVPLGAAAASGKSACPLCHSQLEWVTAHLAASVRSPVQHAPERRPAPRSDHGDEQVSRALHSVPAIQRFGHQTSRHASR